MLVTLWVMSVLVFFLAAVLPGDIGRTILGPYAQADQVVRLDHQLGTDRPLVVRYVSWMGGVFKGDWGTSYLFQTPVRSLVLDKLVNSIWLALFALALVIPVSVLLGILAGMRRDSLTDRVVSMTGLAFLGIPEFVSGAILLTIFSVQLRWLPASAVIPPGSSPLGALEHLLLPAITLTFVLFGYIARMARAGVADVLGSDYVRTATLKGLSTSQILRHHVLRSSMLPTVTVIGATIGWLVGGLVVVETLFNYPGIGKLMLDSAIRHDVMVLESTTLLIAAMYMLGNLAADLVYALLDPRVRYS